MTVRKLYLIAASLAVAIGIFAARMLISPPLTMAATIRALTSPKWRSMRRETCLHSTPLIRGIPEYSTL